MPEIGIKEITFKDHSYCTTALKDGHWLPSPNGSRFWQPNSCVLKDYSSDDLLKCYNNKNFLFIGDNSVRDKYTSFKTKVTNFVKNNSPGPSDATSKFKYEINRNFNSLAADNLKAFYFGDPFINNTEIWDFLNDLKILGPDKSPNSSLQALLKAFGSDLQISNESENVIVIGTGHFYLRNKTNYGGILKWKKTIDSIYEIDSNKLSKSNTKIYISPVIPVVKEKLSSLQYTTVQDEAIDYMNKYLKSIKSQFNFPIVWADMAKGVPEETVDGIRYDQKLEFELMNVLHNHVCNPSIEKDSIKNQYYCCVDYPPPSPFIVVLFIIFSLILPALIILQQSEKSAFLSSSRFIKNLKILPNQKTLIQIFIIGLVLVLSFINDRTPLFEKNHKRVYYNWFLVLSIFTTVSSCLTIETKIGNNHMMNHRQLEEWRGWMVIFVVLIDYMGLSRFEGFKIFYQTIVCGLVFVSGFEYSTNNDKNNHFRWDTIIRNLFRLNIFVFGLSLFTNTPYMKYEYIFLETTFFIIAESILKFNNHRNNSTRYLLTKISIACFILIAIVVLKPVTASIIQVINFILNSKIDPVLLRTLISRYVFTGILGVFFGILYNNYIENPDHPNSLFITQNRDTIGKISALTLFV
ncbi:putative O-acetyltransferase CAS1, partial [Smittium mucronatum]